jgi:formylmethanofuran dehydrogenase subunit C
MARKRGNVITISGIRGMSSGAKMALGVVIIAGAATGGYFLWKDWKRKQWHIAGYLSDAQAVAGTPYDYNERFRRQYYTRQRQLLYQRAGV